MKSSKHCCLGKEVQAWDLPFSCGGGAFRLDGESWTDFWKKQSRTRWERYVFLWILRWQQDAGQIGMYQANKCGLVVWKVCFCANGNGTNQLKGFSLSRGMAKLLPGCQSALYDSCCLSTYRMFTWSNEPEERDHAICHCGERVWTKEQTLTRLDWLCTLYDVLVLRNESKHVDDINLKAADPDLWMICDLSCQQCCGNDGESVALLYGWLLSSVHL